MKNHCGAMMLRWKLAQNAHLLQEQQFNPQITQINADFHNDADKRYNTKMVGNPSEVVCYLICENLRNLRTKAFSRFRAIRVFASWAKNCPSLLDPLRG